jgi:OmcA/MtrC family decaheme c-type cytochrome
LFATYTFSNTIPADATGSYAMAMQGYISTTVKKADGSTLLAADGKASYFARDAGYNPIVYFPVTDAKAVVRRAVVDRADCNKCHHDIGARSGLSIHGGSRQNPDYCVFCHRVNAVDNTPAPGVPQSISFEYMTHRIHTGEEAANPYVINGTVSYGDVVYPGDRAKCSKCHLPSTNLLPLPTTDLGITTPAGATLPVTSVCSGCHDSKVAGGHISLNTTADKTETCVVCHAEGREAAVGNHEK